MGSPPHSFSLDRTIFNETLYSRIREFWFEGIPDDARVPPVEVALRWFGGNMTPEESKAFDKDCHYNFGHALEALGPEKLALPKFENYETDVENAAKISAPLLREVTDAQAQDEDRGPETLVSLIILLDQMPRNIYRDNAGLRQVYGHYDRLAFTLLRSSIDLSPSPMDHQLIRDRPTYASWCLIPLMHSEHLPSHNIYMDRTKRSRDDMERLGDEGAVKYAERSIEFEIKHQDPLWKFGRYPHRNEALGRKSTDEEEEYLKSGETFGVKQSQDKEEEPKRTDKSEL